MFSRFFIDRPIFAVVISLFIALAGLAAMRVLPDRAVPGDRPAGRHGDGRLSGRLGPGARVHRRRADRERHQRHRGHALHELHLGLQRRGADPGHLQHRRRRRQGRAQREQPREAGGAALPLEVRRQGVTVEKGSSSFLQVLAFYSPDGTLRRLLHVQLRDAERAGPGEAHPGHHQRADLRRQGLRDAHLDAPGSPARS